MPRPRAARMPPATPQSSSPHVPTSHASSASNRTASRSDRRPRCSRPWSLRRSRRGLRWWSRRRVLVGGPARSSTPAAICACAPFRSKRSPRRSAPDTSLVAFSLVQSATGEVADAAATRATAARFGARDTVRCDAGGGMAAGRRIRFRRARSATRTSGCARRAGVSFLTLSRGRSRGASRPCSRLVRGRRSLDVLLRPRRELAGRRPPLRRLAGVAGLRGRRAGPARCSPADAEALLDPHDETGGGVPRAHRRTRAGTAERHRDLA